MSDTPDTPAPYRVSYSQEVIDQFRALADRAQQRGYGKSFLDALAELDNRLRVYPQFGDPLMDLWLPSAQLWVGTVPPVVIRYVLHNDSRAVMVVGHVLLLPNAGF